MVGQKGIPARYGGIERHVEELSTRLSRLGMDVVVYCRPWYAEPVNAKHGQVNVSLRPIFLPSFRTKHLDAITHSLIATVHACLFERADVIHFHGVGPALLSWIPRVLRPQARVFFTFHSVDRQHDKWGRFARLMLRMGEFCGATFADRTITVSRALQRYAQEVYGAHTSYLPNGVTVFPDPSPSALTEWNLVPGHYLLFVGRLIALKGVHTLLDAYRLLPPAVRDAYPLVIAGESLSASYLHELTARARGLNVRFVGNQVGEKLAALFHYASVFVQPSETESMPIVVLEAAGAGIPVVASGIDAHREILGEQGQYFETKNALDLARIINETLAGLDAARAAAKEFAPTLRETYSWDRIAIGTRDLYLSTAPAPSGALGARRA